MKKLETFYQLLELLSYGKNQAKTSEQLAINFGSGKGNNCKRKLRALAHDARLNGHWVIGDDSGYYIAIKMKESGEGTETGDLQLSGMNLRQSQAAINFPCLI